MPYNYLLDDKYREGAKIDLKNCIIIIDEAHNIKGFAEECSNFSITTEQLKSCLKELQWIDSCEEAGCDLEIETVRSLVNHWIHFIKDSDVSDDIVEIKEKGFPSNAIVLEEKQVVTLI